MLRRVVLTCLTAALSAVLVVACGAPPNPPPPQPAPAKTPNPLPTPFPTSIVLPLVPTPLPEPTVAPTAQAGRQTADPTAVVVFASSPFGAAFSELGSAFMLTAPDTTGVSYRFDNATLLGSMIQQGADADVFASLDPAQMDALAKANLLEGTPSILASDRLAIVTSQPNPQHLQSFKDLANDSARFIIAAPGNPTSAAIKAAFDKASADPAYGADFGAKADRHVLARDGDDRFVVSRIVAQEVSAGVVYASSLDPQSRSKLQVIEIPDAVNVAVQYPIALLKHSSNPRGGQAFINYILSQPAQDILSRYGFLKSK